MTCKCIAIHLGGNFGRGRKGMRAWCSSLTLTALLLGMCYIIILNFYVYVDERGEVRSSSFAVSAFYWTAPGAHNCILSYNSLNIDRWVKLRTYLRAYRLSNTCRSTINVKSSVSPLFQIPAWRFFKLSYWHCICVQCRQYKRGYRIVGVGLYVKGHK